MYLKKQEIYKIVVGYPWNIRGRINWIYTYQVVIPTKTGDDQLIFVGLFSYLC